MITIKANNARIVLEHTDAPIFFPELFPDCYGSCEDCFLKHVFKFSRAHRSRFVDGALVSDATGECFVTAVLTPSLCQRF